MENGQLLPSGVFKVEPKGSSFAATGALVLCDAVMLLEYNADITVSVLLTELCDSTPFEVEFYILDRQAGGYEKLCSCGPYNASNLTTSGPPPFSCHVTITLRHVDWDFDCSVWCDGVPQGTKRMDTVFTQGGVPGVFLAIRIHGSDAAISPPQRHFREWFGRAVALGTLDSERSLLAVVCGKNSVSCVRLQLNRDGCEQNLIELKAGNHHTRQDIIKKTPQGGDRRPQQSSTGMVSFELCIIADHGSWLLLGSPHSTSHPAGECFLFQSPHKPDSAPPQSLTPFNPCTLR
eukprot:NODE_1072_length_1127_cov_276.667904_g820_i0.p1 GENE.NODE_1072_length_1127_cov_276.667904_g820_i0~~NODE_1072_length_1127_cov_276.667904_g820_i0.p1  ORF type:complete len:291 (+),score=44.11 NODE_1072_length_1127_cov_276.667904_g820_i0:253-1125(+)